MSFDGLAGVGKAVFNGGVDLLETSEQKEARAKFKEDLNKHSLMLKVGAAAAAAFFALSLIFASPVTIVLSLIIFAPVGVLAYDSHKANQQMEKLVDDHWKMLSIGNDKQALYKEITQDTLLLKHLPLYS